MSFSSSVSLWPKNRIFYTILNLSNDKDHTCRPFILAAVFQFQAACNPHNMTWHNDQEKPKPQSCSSEKVVWQGKTTKL